MKVLISPGYGAGFSTWEPVYNKMIATDKTLIEAFEKGISKEDFSELLESLGYMGVYLGGFEQLKVVTVPDNTYFQIREYDGAEYIETFDPEDKDWIYSGYEMDEGDEK